MPYPQETPWSPANLLSNVEDFGITYETKSETLLFEIAVNDQRGVEDSDTMHEGDLNSSGDIDFFWQSPTPGTVSPPPYSSPVTYSATAVVTPNVVQAAAAVFTTDMGSAAQTAMRHMAMKPMTMSITSHLRSADTNSISIATAAATNGSSTAAGGFFSQLSSVFQQVPVFEIIITSHNIVRDSKNTNHYVATSVGRIAGSKVGLVVGTMFPFGWVIGPLVGGVVGGAIAGTIAPIQLTEIADDTGNH